MKKRTREQEIETIKSMFSWTNIKFDLCINEKSNPNKNKWIAIFQDIHFDDDSFVDAIVIIEYDFNNLDIALKVIKESMRKKFYKLIATINS